MTATISKGTNLYAASQQWAKRPADERFETLAELRDAVAARKSQSFTTTMDTAKMRVYAKPNNELALIVKDRTRGEDIQLTPTNWAFGQLSRYANVPAQYARSVPAELAAINLQWGLEHSNLREDALVLGRRNGDDTVRSLTSTSYGRIWDLDVVRAVERINENGRWQVPLAAYGGKNSKKATTLYASDRDVFIFLVDPANAIEVEGETLYRGFYTWNSEVGSQVFGLCSFLYRYVCQNRIIWGATNIRELRIRHTGGAPERFAYEARDYLERYANEDTKLLCDGVRAAKAFEIPDAGGIDGRDNVVDWMRARGFQKAVAEASIASAIAEEGRARSLWDIVNGITAYARSIENTDVRVDLETKAGQLIANVVK